MESRIHQIAGRPGCVARYGKHENVRRDGAADADRLQRHSAEFLIIREKDMTGIMNLSVKTAIIGLVLACLLFSGCKGSDTREEVDSTVEELAGKKKVDQMKAMERSIGEIRDQEDERLKELDDIDDAE